MTEPAEQPSSLRLLRFLGGTLTSALLETLAIAPNGVRRYNELLRLLAPTSKRTLTGALRRLERVGVIERQAFPEVPVRVEYSLTPLGYKFVESVRLLSEWACLHPDELETVCAKEKHPNTSQS